MDVQQLKNIADRVPAFQGLTTHQLHKLISAGQLHTYPRGHMLCREGDASTEMYILLSGQLEVSGAGIELSVIESSNIVGEMSLITGLPRCATVEARSEISVFEITAAGLKNLMRDNADLAATVYRNIIHSLCGKLREANEEILRSVLSV